MRRRVVACSLFVTPLLLAVALHDLGTFRSFESRFAEDRDGLSRRIQEIAAARKHRPGLEAELARYTSELVALQKILPYGLDVDEFRNDLQHVASPFEVVVQENSTTLEKDGRLLKASMKVLFRGEREARRSFLERLSRLARQSTLEIQEESPEFIRGTLVFWAYEPPRAQAVIRCEPGGLRRPWTPFAHELIARRRESCLALARETHREPVLEEMLDRFEILKAEVRELAERITSLQHVRAQAWKKLLTRSV